MSQAQYLAAYPKPARRQHLSGRGVVDCVVGAEGRPVDCRIVSEEPAGAGFGEAALKLARFYRFRAPCPGEPSRVKLPISFVLPR